MILEYPEDESFSNDKNINIKKFTRQPQKKEEEPPKSKRKKMSKSKYQSSLANQKKLQENAHKFSEMKTEMEKADYFREVCQENVKSFYVNMFMRKMKQLLIRQSPTNHQLLQQISVSQKDKVQPIRLNLNIQIIWNMLCIIQILLLFIYSTLSIGFSEVQKANQIRIIAFVSFIIQILEIASKFTTKSNLKVSKAKERQNKIEAHIQSYLKKLFIYDIFLAFLLLSDSITYFSWLKWLRLFLALKIIFVFEKMRYLQMVMIKKFYKEQYWSLVKVFLINFLVAHILSILLILMAGLNPRKNWLIEKELHHLLWHEKYIWSCYWSINIMLTVGFGDISAVTTQEAMCLIFIEMLSCILLTYNINSVGTILRSIASYEIEKQNNIKIFTRMQDRSSLSEETKHRIVNFINESSDMKKKYNIDQEQKLINSLPETLNGEYQKEVNFKMFFHLPFFRHISEKTLAELAIKMERRLSHPQQIILTPAKVPKIAIVSGKGAVSLTMNYPSHYAHGKEFQRYEIQDKQKKLLSLYFLINKPLPYGIKSCKYSELFMLQRQQMEKILREVPYNFQYYCMQKQKDQYNHRELEIFPCKLCSSRQYHTLYHCPKFHYLPLGQIIIQKHKSQNKKKAKKVLVAKLLESKKKRMNKRSGTLKGRRSALVDLHEIQRLPSFSSFIKCNFHEQGSYQSGKADLQGLVNSEASQFFQNLREVTKQDLSMTNLYIKLKKDIKEEISKVPLLLNECKVFEWNLQCDIAFDYQYYFTENNPSNLKNTSEKRLKKNNLVA